MGLKINFNQWKKKKLQHFYVSQNSFRNFNFVEGT